MLDLETKLDLILDLLQDQHQGPGVDLLLCMNSYLDLDLDLNGGPGLDAGKSTGPRRRNTS